MNRNTYLISGIIILLLGIVGLWFMYSYVSYPGYPMMGGFGPGGMMGRGMMQGFPGGNIGRDYSKLKHESNGERIYLTATSASGRPITHQMPAMMGRTRMSGMACVDCHGVDGQGGTIAMMMWRVEVPNITQQHLTEEEEDHPPYTRETIKRAITQGLDPAGKRLSWAMPRWQISGEDLNDLIDYLEKL